ncbi:sulfate transporter CysZ [Facilibium subflavum]|uniref:sulfate transporter CysZ n=1 Tax=Facilibium subflavum TaxID=2219058 RepID=UPI000E64E75C|nr:sulfate transporter CysZ [Facilibium subflavum]
MTNLNKQAGIDYLLSGFRLIFSKGIKRYTIIPLILNLLIFIGLWWFALHEIAVFTQWLDQHLASWLRWLNWLIYMVGIISMLLFTTYLFTVIALIIASPFYSFLAEKVQFKLTNKAVDIKLSWHKLLLIAPKAVVREISKMLSFLPWVIIILVCYFIPVVNLFTAVYWLILLSWFNVVQYADYAFDNNEIPYPLMKQKLKQKRTLSFGFGFFTTLLLMIPLLNIFVIPAAIAGATKMYVEHWQNQ